MELVYNKLYLGNSSDAKNLPQLINHNIDVVLNVANDLSYHIEHKYEHGKELVQYKVGMTDGLNNAPELFVAAVLTLKGLLDRGNTILIHCHQGRSRSPSVIAAYLAIKENKTFLEKLQELAAIRSIVNPEPGMIQYALSCMPKVEAILKIYN